MPGWREVLCYGLVLLLGGCSRAPSTVRGEPTERVKGGDSATLHIRALIAKGQLAEAEALLVEAIATGLVSWEAASRLREAIRQRRQRPQHGSDDLPVTPWVTPEEPPGERRTCATAFPSHPTCHELPEEYTYHGVQQALNAMKEKLGAKNLTLHSPDTSRSGPCPGIGDHYNVRKNGERVGSITCCPCCVDTEPGPLMWVRCRIVW